MEREKQLQDYPEVIIGALLLPFQYAGISREPAFVLILRGWTGSAFPGIIPYSWDDSGRLSLPRPHM